MLEVLLSSLLATAALAIEESCHLPAGGPGVCVPLSKCANVAALIGNLQKPLPKDVSLLIRESFFCGITGGVVTVCCSPDDLTSPLSNLPEMSDRATCGLQEGLPAQCALYSTCSPFVQMMQNLRKPLPPAVPALVRSSYLCGVEDTPGGRRLPKICCPEAALSPVLPEEPDTPDGGEGDVDDDDDDERILEPEMFRNHPARRFLSDPVTCGIPFTPPRIVGGEDAKLGQFPWLVNIGYSKGSGGGDLVYKCGGTLVGPRWVLTAAHCVTKLPSGYRLGGVRVGEHDLSKEEDCLDDDSFCSQPPQNFQVEEVIFHEMYNKPKNIQNDIALIKLDREVHVSETVCPVCLPWWDERENYLSGRSGFDDEETPVAVAGWGATTRRGRKPADVLQWLPVNVTDGERCKELYAKRGGVLTEKQICAGGEAGKDSCVGDSGSGLMRNIWLPGDFSTRYQLIGVVSFGPRLCGTKGIPGVYSRVNSYLGWILDTVHSHM